MLEKYEKGKHKKEEIDNIFKQCKLQEKLGAKVWTLAFR